MHKHPISLSRQRRVPKQFSWVDQRLVRERYIDQLSHEACAKPAKLSSHSACWPIDDRFTRS